jgi:UDP-N-acetylglucosamine 1-carboxyvinyltransferase
MSEASMTAFSAADPVAGETTDLPVNRACLLIEGGASLAGEVTVDGSKNAALPLVAAAASISAPVDLEGVPACTDVDAMLDLLQQAGWAVSGREGMAQVRIGAVQAASSQPVLAGAMAIRASYYLAAPLIAAYGQAILPWPGGCNVGKRGMDLHFMVYQAFGDHVETDDGGYAIRPGQSLQGGGAVHISLPFRSRGATVAALLRALVAGRPVTVSNPNLSAELHSVYRALAVAGCELEIESSQVRLWPVQPREPVCWRVPGDKIEAGTLACAIAATGGHGTIHGVFAGDVAPLVEALSLLGVPVTVESDAGRVTLSGSWEPSGAPLRAFASLAPGGLDADWEPGLMALALGLPGLHRFADPINPGRHGNLIPQLHELGAAIIVISPTECRLTGPQRLIGATVEAADIRTGSALIGAALTAVGTTVLTGLPQLRRGHADLPGKLLALGAQLQVRP